jgi:hypothetical protein
MIRADLKFKMRGYGVRPQDQTFFRKRITPLLEFGTFAVIVHRFGRCVPAVDDLHLSGRQHGLSGHCPLHVHRESDIGPGLVIRNCNAIFILDKPLALILNFLL